jgi:hypothetical protein
MGTNSDALTPKVESVYDLTKQEFQIPYNHLVDGSNLGFGTTADPDPSRIQLQESNSCNNILLGLGSPMKSIIDDGPQNPAQLFQLES